MITNNSEYSDTDIRVHALKQDEGEVLIYGPVPLDENRVYVIDSLPAGDYIVEAYIDQDGDGNPDPEKLIRCYEVEGDTGCTEVLLGEGEEKTGIDIVLGEIIPIGDGDIYGTIINKTKFKNSPIIVEAYSQDNTLFYSTVADSTGHYALLDLLPGVYTVSAFIDLNNNNKYDESEISKCYIDTTKDSVCTKLVFDSNEVYNNIDIILESQENINNSSLSGKVITNRDNVGTIRVVCENSAFHKEVLLQKPGEFTFVNLPSGNYLLSAFEDANGDSVYNFGERRNCFKENNESDDCDSIFVGVNAHVENKNINLFFPFLQIKGKVVDNISQEGIIYAILNEDSLVNSQPVIQIPVNENNEFVMDVFTKGTFYLFAFKDVNNNMGADNNDFFGIYDADGDTKSDPIIINDFMNDIEVELVIDKNIGSSMEKFGIINGNIILPDKGPKEQFGIKAIDTSGKVFQVMADSNLHYSLSVVPGSYFIMTEETENYYSTFYRNTTNLKDAIKINVGNNDTISDINIEVQQKIILKGRLTGTIMDSITNLPIPNAMVHIYNDSAEFMTNTDNDGIYNFPDVYSALYIVDVQKEGYLPLFDNTVFVEPDTTTIFSLKLVPMSIDTIPPTIKPVYPKENDIEVSIFSNIVIDITDNESGVNRNSISLNIDNRIVDFGISDIPDGFRITYIPEEPFNEGDTINVNVSAYDNSSLFSSLNYSFVIQKDQQPPVFTMEPMVVQVTYNTALIEFSTDELARAEVAYLVDNTNDTLYFKTEYFTTTFDIVLSNLESNTLYKYYVKVFDENNNGPTNSRLNTFKTLSLRDTIPPVFLNGPFAKNISTSNALISFQTDEPTYAKVFYGTQSGVLNNMELDTLFGRMHNIMLNGLQSNMEYFYYVQISDQDSNITLSEEDNFKTKDNPDLAPPIFLQGPSIVNICSDQATLFCITNEMSKLTISLTSNNGQSFSLTDIFLTEHNLFITGLFPSTTYTYSLFAVDMYNNKSTTITGQFVTKAAPDTAAPEIFEVRSINPGQHSITIAWKNNEPATGNIFYGLDSSQMQIFTDPAFVLSHKIMLSQLLADTLYYFYIQSIDPSSNISKSELYTFRTNAIPDTVGPIIIAGPVITAYSDKAIVTFTTDEPGISYVTAWEPSHPEFAMVFNEDDYYINHNIILSDLEPGMSYQIEIQVDDRAGNHTYWPGTGGGKLNKKSGLTFVTDFAHIEQTGSHSFNTNTQADTTTPKIVEGPTEYERTNNAITLYWKTDEPARGEIYYGKFGDFSEYQTENKYITEHYVTVYNLEPNQEYNFLIFNTDINSNGPVQYSDTLIYKTKVSMEHTPPQIVEDIAITDLSSDRAVIISETDRPSNAYMSLYDNSSLIKDYATEERKKKHKIFLTNLYPSTNYKTENKYCDGNGNCSDEYEKDFMTKDVPDTEAPNIQNKDTESGLDYVNVKISFDELSTVLLEYKELTGSEYISVSSLEPSYEHNIMITNLKSNTVYKLKIYYQDTYGNVDSVGGLVVSTEAEPDTIAPAMPQNLIYNIDEYNILHLKWNKVTSDDLKAYNVYIKEDSTYKKIGSNIVDTLYSDERDNYGNLEYGVSAIDYNGNESDIASVDIVKVEEPIKDGNLKKMYVKKNYPNPFNPQTVIEYYVPKRGLIEIGIYNIIGQKVYVYKKVQDAGWHRFIWHANFYSSGIYFYKLKIGEEEIVKKMLLLK